MHCKEKCVKSNNLIKSKDEYRAKNMQGIGGIINCN